MTPARSRVRAVLPIILLLALLPASARIAAQDPTTTPSPLPLAPTNRPMMTEMLLYTDDPNDVAICQNSTTTAQGQAPDRDIDISNVYLFPVGPGTLLNVHTSKPPIELGALEDFFILSFQAQGPDGSIARGSFVRGGGWAMETNLDAEFNQVPGGWGTFHWAPDGSINVFVPFEVRDFGVEVFRQVGEGAPEWCDVFDPTAEQVRAWQAEAEQAAQETGDTIAVEEILPLEEPPANMQMPLINGIPACPLDLPPAGPHAFLVRMAGPSTAQNDPYKNAAYVQIIHPDTIPRWSPFYWHLPDPVTPENEQIPAQTEGGPRNYSLWADWSMTGDGLVDISDPANPVRLSTGNPPPIGVSPGGDFLRIIPPPDATQFGFTFVTHDENGQASCGSVAIPVEPWHSAAFTWDRRIVDFTVDFMNEAFWEDAVVIDDPAGDFVQCGNPEQAAAGPGLDIRTLVSSGNTFWHEFETPFGDALDQGLNFDIFWKGTEGDTTDVYFVLRGRQGLIERGRADAEFSAIPGTQNAIGITPGGAGAYFMPPPGFTLDHVVTQSVDENGNARACDFLVLSGQ